ncbi:MAG TPA: putative molybdenum carrier protein [Streptosporangiaceae bacterium]
MSARRLTPAGSEPGSATEGELRAELARTPGICVLTGGQTGVDTMAAEAALKAGLPVHLVFPLGFLQEDGPITPARRGALRGASFHQMASPDFAVRTRTCVSLADAVILIDPAGGEGCQETVRAADATGCPLLFLGEGAEPGQIRDWLAQVGARIVMVAGCRASLLAAAGREQRAKAQVAAIIAGLGISRQAGDPSPP